MARIIEFHVPADFKPKIKWVPQEERCAVVPKRCSPRTEAG